MSVFKKWLDNRLENVMLNTVDKIGPSNLDSVIDSVEKIDSYNHNPFQLNKNLNGYLWLYSVLLLLLSIVLVWNWAWYGFIAGVFFSVSTLIIAWTVHCLMREVAIHPGGVHGYNFTQKHLKIHAHIGSRLHNIFRKYLMYRWYYFLYTKSGKHWSYRPYVLFIFILLLFYLSILVGISFISLFVAVFIFVISNTSIPIAFFMGRSHLDSHTLFKKIRVVSGVKWVSLLDDGVSLSELPETIEEKMKIFNIIGLTNFWSLRIENDNNWLNVVKDFINYSAVIVIKAEQVDAVRQELDILATTHYFERIIVICNSDSDVELVPKLLVPCIMTEESTLEMLSLAYTSPKKFLENMKNRFYNLSEG